MNYKKIKEKIESKRYSKRIVWKMLVFIKDAVSSLRAMVCKLRILFLKKLFDIYYRKTLSTEEYKSLIIKDLEDGYPLFDYADFYDFVSKKPDFFIYVEVGSWKGFSTVYLAKSLQKRKNAKLYAIDLWEMTNGMLYHWQPCICKNLKDIKNTLLAKFGTNVNPSKLLYDIYTTNIINNGVRNVVTDIREDSTKASRFFENGQVDFVFIDACHSYEKVKEDILAWKPKVRKGGIIAGHDYPRKGVMNAVHEVFGIPLCFNKEVWYVEI